MTEQAAAFYFSVASTAIILPSGINTDTDNNDTQAITFRRHSASSGIY
ncbi:MAG TPA: hypothetical protein VI306_26380 [Pyrinomonadaceae bacterium]